MQGRGMFLHDFLTALNVSFGLFRITGSGDVKKRIAFVHGGEAVESDDNSISVRCQSGLATPQGIADDSEFGIRPDGLTEIDVVGKETSLRSIGAVQTEFLDEKERRTSYPGGHCIWRPERRWT